MPPTLIHWLPGFSINLRTSYHMRRFFKITGWTVIILFSVYGLLWLTPYRTVLPGYHSFFYTAEAYQNKCVSIRRQVKIAGRERKAELLQKSVSEDLFPYWSGTRWGFNGTTETPGEGRIACGYFVTTVLRDAGCKVDRIRMARLASEEFIKEVVAEKNIKRYSKIPLTDFLADIRKKKNQLYIVGLDSHVGFLSCEENECWFIHSSGGFPWAVIKEKAEESNALEHSNYRVTGCITSDEKFLERWEGE